MRRSTAPSVFENASLRISRRRQQQPPSLLIAPQQTQQQSLTTLTNRIAPTLSPLCPLSPVSTLQHHASRSYGTDRMERDEFYIPSPQTKEEYRKLADKIDATELGQLSKPMLGKANDCIYYWSHNRSVEGAQIAEKLLERIHDEVAIGNNPFAFVTQKLYSTVIYAWCHSRNVQGPEKATEVFLRMMERHRAYQENGGAKEETGNSYKAQPTTEMVHTVLLSWVHSDRDDAIGQVEDLFVKLEESQSSRLLDSKSYNMFINIYANQIGSMTYAQKAEDVLLHMADVNKDGQLNVSPNAPSFNTVLKAWRNSRGGVESGKRALDILRIMIKLYKDGHEDLRPNEISFRAVMSTLGLTMKYDGRDDSEAFYTADLFPEVVDLLLESFHNTDAEKDREVMLQLIAWILRKLERSNLPDSLDRVYALVQQVREKANMDLDAISYSSIIGTHLRQQGSSEEAQNVLDQMIQKKELPNPNASCFNKIINFHSKCNKRKEAKEVYGSMRMLAKQDGFDCHPDTSTYSILMDMYFLERKKDSLKKSMALLEDMEMDISSGALKQVSLLPYSLVLQQIVSKKEYGRSASTGTFAHGLLMKMIEHYEHGRIEYKPGIIIYNSVLSILSGDRSRTSAEKATSLLAQMEDIGNESNVPFADSYSYTHAIRSWCRTKEPDSIEKIFDIFEKLKERDLDDASNVKLDLAVFETILLELYEQKKREHALRAKQLLEEMMDLYRSGRDDLKPSSRCINLVLSALSTRNPNSSHILKPTEFHDLVLQYATLYREGDIHMDNISFNIGLKIWSQSCAPSALKKASELASVMKSLGVKFDEHFIFLLLDIFVKFPGNINNFQKAFDSFDENEKSTNCYNRMLNIWAKSKSNDKVKMAHQLLQQMSAMGKVDLISYNSMLNACAHSRSRGEVEKKDDLALAKETYQELLRAFDPDEISYATIIRANKMLSHNEEEFHMALKEIFDSCSEHGLVGKMVLKELKYSLTPEKRLELFGTNFEGDINSSWSRNIL